MIVYFVAMFACACVHVASGGNFGNIGEFHVVLVECV